MLSLMKLYVENKTGEVLSIQFICTIDYPWHITIKTLIDCLLPLDLLLGLEQVLRRQQQDRL